MSKKEFKKARMEYLNSRMEYILQIMCKFKKSRGMPMPTAAEERSFEEALRHVVHLVSSKEYAPPPPPPPAAEEGTCNRKSERKQCLKNILDHLRWLERSRLYDPPSDDEIGHYLIIRKYTRSILAFHLAAARISLLTDDDFLCGDFFGSISLFVTRNYAENIIDINQHMADLSGFLLEMNMEDVTPLKPLMHTKDSYEILKPPTNGNKERSCMFYEHKFHLAVADLKSSEFAYCHPLEDEKKSYVQALDSISSPSIDDVTNVFSDELFSIYLEWIRRHITDIETYFEQIKRWSLKSLSLVDWWEASGKQVTERIHILRHQYFDNKEDKELLKTEIRKELTEAYKLPIGDLPSYISKIDHCLTVTLFADVLTDVLSWDHSNLYIVKLCRRWKQVGWEAVHALSLLKQEGPIGCGLQEQPIFRYPQEHVHMENGQATRNINPEHIILPTKDDQDENVVTLEGFIDELKQIGDSEIILDEEERELVHRIWGNVASAIHFYVSAMAYEQRRYVTQHYPDSFHLSMLKLSEEKPKETIDLEEVGYRKFYMKDNIKNFVQILVAFKAGLEEKFRSL